MRVDSMTETEEVIFSKECKRLLDLCDGIGTKGDKKHAKREAKAILKEKYYWIPKDEDMFFIVMKAVYNIMNNQDKVKIKHFYHIICDPDLDKGFWDLHCIPCDCAGCVEQLSKNWIPKFDKTLQPRYFIKLETCKYSSILRG